MKTILYQPLFINPQAYFVFPQLYHIEKGDSYIEPANITGQLIINDLTQSLTSTPILNVVETNNIVEDDNEPYSDLTIRVTGVTENKYLIVRQGRGKPETRIKKDGVSYQTKASYNGNAINYHSDQADNDDRLVIGSTKDSLGNQCFIGCHSDILIFNRTLTEYEISWVKNNMMCSKQQEHDIDL